MAMKAFRAAVLLVVSSLVASTAIARDKPNIVLVFMDNFGWGEPGFNGGGVTRGTPTPRLDTLASEGLRLTNFNVEAQCTPSRSAIMTGRYAIRSGNGTVPLGGGVYGLVQWEVTMAEMLSDAGCATGMFGKWHLGRTKGRFPTFAKFAGGKVPQDRVIDGLDMADFFLGKQEKSGREGSSSTWATTSLASSGARPGLLARWNARRAARRGLGVSRGHCGREELDIPDHLVVIVVNAEKTRSRRSTSAPLPPRSRA